MASAADNIHPTRTAVVFPGQGSQAVAMLEELAAEYSQVRQTFEQASSAIDIDLWQICQDEQQLAKTEYTQPALLAASIAIWRIIQPMISHQPHYLAGHSLGEYSALCAAGVIDFEAAVSLVHTRGKLMQAAVEGVPTAMAAVLGLEDQCVITLCEQACEHVEGAVVNAANFNSPGQVVVSGNELGVNHVIDSVQTTGKRAIPLKVSVPSHCALMQPATEALAEALATVTFHTPTIPVIQNRHARVETSAADIKQALTEQLSEPVLWTQTMEAMVHKHIGLLIECGSGNVLSNLAKRQTQPIACYPTDKPMRIEKLLKELT